MSLTRDTVSESSWLHYEVMDSMANSGTNGLTHEIPSSPNAALTVVDENGRNYLNDDGTATCSLISLTDIANMDPELDDNSANISDNIKFVSKNGEIHDFNLMSVNEFMAGERITSRSSECLTEDMISSIEHIKSDVMGSETQEILSTQADCTVVDSSVAYHEDLRNIIKLIKPSELQSRLDALELVSRLDHDETEILEEKLDMHNNDFDIGDGAQISELPIAIAELILPEFSSGTIFEKMDEKERTEELSEFSSNEDIVPLTIHQENIKRRDDGAFVRVVTKSLLKTSADVPYSAATQRSKTNSVTLVKACGNVAGDIEPEYFLKDEAQCFRCTVCDAVFQRPGRFKLHAMRHNDQKPFKCSHEGCDWAFARFDKLARHLTSHQNVRSWKCDEAGCGKCFSTQSNLRTHKKQKHNPEKVQQLSFPVSLEFQSSSKLCTSVEVAPPMLTAVSNKPFKCLEEGCGMAYSSEPLLRKHEKKHERQRSNRCEFCGRSFLTLSALRTHGKIHTNERPYKCEIEGCPWSFHTAPKLKRHMLTHNDDRHFPCEVAGCAERFRRMEHLKCHVISKHEKIKPWKCTLPSCGATFVSRSALHGHERKHSEDGGRLVFHCPLEGCSKRYLNRTTHAQHLQMHFSKGDLSLWPLLTASNSTPVNTLATVQSAGDTLTDSCAAETKGNNTKFIHMIRIEALPVTYEMASSESVFLTSDSANQAAAPEPEQYLTAPVRSPQPSGSQDGDCDLQKLKFELGSSRTDYITNQLVSELARKRRLVLKETGTFEGLMTLQEITGNRELFTCTDPVSSVPGCAHKRRYSPSDMMSSHAAMTFRDPETGITYVQTQLLQDDPPNPTVYNNVDVCDDLSNEGPAPEPHDLSPDLSPDLSRGTPHLVC